MKEQEKVEEFETSKEEVLLPPSDGQVDAIDFIIENIIKLEPVVGFIAPGGCGKTFSLKHLAKDTRLSGIPIVFTATTNKAASVMKGEGLKGAKTLHSAISKHVPTVMYAHMESLFKIHKKNPDTNQKIPQIVLDFLEEIDVKEETFFDYKNEKELIAENGVDSYDDRIFSHYATSDYLGGVCIIDEASMLPTKSQYQKDNIEGGRLKLKSIGLDIVNKIYDTVVLVGDDSQLPPINGDSSFDDIPKTTLTENFRSDKGLLRFLDYVRSGNPVADFVPESGENVRIVASIGPEYFKREDLIANNATHICYKNKTRFEITKTIRGDMSSDPVKDEPILYKGANIDTPNDSISRNEIGVFDGMMGRWDNHSQVVQGQHFDCYGKGYTYLSYAYAITCHSAQGSKFDHVIIHNDDVPHFIDSETKNKWIYTAVSRAVKSITVVY